ncbi:MAG TPA: hypothetical protein VGP70_22430, partial [Actinomadura sp.]|nr:hypothetical protein [Actinomadura sp.]
GYPKSTPATTRSPAPASTVKDCFDGNCTLMLSKPVKIRLDAKKYYSPDVTVAAVDVPAQIIACGALDA